MSHSDTYTITVIFERSRGDDENVIVEGRKEPFNKDTAIAQFVRELQLAYDETNIAGMFNVVECTL